MKKDTISTVFLVLVFLVGLSLLLYPAISDYWNSLHQSQMVSDYTQQVSKLDNEAYDKLLQQARDYNESLLYKDNIYRMTEENLQEYHSLLNVSGNGILGYIEIPSIDCSLPIYHGVEESALQIAVGHIDWTALPVGGASTHCVLSGHRGLPSAKLFSELDKLVVGDTFLLQVLDETLTYEVDQILIVEPDQVEPLNIQAGQDLCTLVTCTPYGINTHRLLVRGHRIENEAQALQVRVTADAIQLDPMLMAPIAAAPMLLVLLILLLVTTRRKR